MYVFCVYHFGLQQFRWYHMNHLEIGKTGVAKTTADGMLAAIVSGIDEWTMRRSIDIRTDEKMLHCLFTNKKEEIDNVMDYFMRRGIKIKFQAFHPGSMLPLDITYLQKTLIGNVSRQLYETKAAVKSKKRKSPPA